LDFQNGADNGIIRPNQVNGVIFRDCDFSGMGATTWAIYNNQETHDIQIIDCTITGGGGSGRGISGYTYGDFIVDNCTIDGVVYGIYLGGVTAYVKDTILGGTASNTNDLHLGASRVHKLYMQNSKFDETSGIDLDSNEYGASIVCEDHQQIQDWSKAFYYHGTIESDTETVRTGGSDVSAFMLTLKDECGIGYPLTLTDNPLTGDFKIWVPDEATTLSLYLKASTTYTVYPNADELYVEVDYKDGATTRTTATSSETLTDANWTAFTVPFTPAVNSWAYITVKLGFHEASKGISVDLRPILTQ